MSAHFDAEAARCSALASVAGRLHDMCTRACIARVLTDARHGTASGGSRAKFEAAMRAAKAVLRFGQLNALALALLLEARHGVAWLDAFDRLARAYAFVAASDVGRLMAKLDATTPPPTRGKFVFTLNDSLFYFFYYFFLLL